MSIRDECDDCTDEQLSRRHVLSRELGDGLGDGLFAKRRLDFRPRATGHGRWNSCTVDKSSPIHDQKFTNTAVGEVVA